MKELDLDWVRGRFPALSTDWALFDNAGGSVPLGAVVDAVADHMRRLGVQLGASYALSEEATARVEAGHRAAEALVGAGPGEVVLGASTTQNARLLAASLRPLWRDGDEVVVSDLDHEANVGPWRGLERSGLVVREWPLDPETAALRWDDLEPLLTERTRLVAFTHVSNVVGTIHDVAGVAARLRERGILSCVDGVAYAPHRRVDVAALGCDAYLASLYKVYGPHIALMYVRREVFERARGQNHFFVGEGELPYKLEPGGANHELASSVPAIVDYLLELDRRHGADRQSLDGAFERVAAHEEALVGPLLERLRDDPRVRIVGEPRADRTKRVPTVAFSVEGAHASAIPPLLDGRGVAIRWGDFYARRAIRSLGLEERGGVVRASLVHYNAPAEVERLIDGLGAALDSLHGARAR